MSPVFVECDGRCLRKMVRLEDNQDYTVSDIKIKAKELLKKVKIHAPKEKQDVLCYSIQSACESMIRLIRGLPLNCYSIHNCKELYNLIEIINRIVDSNHNDSTIRANYQEENKERNEIEPVSPPVISDYKGGLEAALKLEPDTNHASTSAQPAEAVIDVNCSENTVENIITHRYRQSKDGTTTTMVKVKWVGSNVEKEMPLSTVLNWKQGKTKMAGYLLACSRRAKSTLIDRNQELVVLLKESNC